MVTKPVDRQMTLFGKGIIEKKSHSQSSNTHAIKYCVCIKSQNSYFYPMYLRHTRCGFHNNIQLLATSSSVAAS